MKFANCIYSSDNVHESCILLIVICLVVIGPSLEQALVFTRFGDLKINRACLRLLSIRGATLMISNLGEIGILSIMEFLHFVYRVGLHTGHLAFV